MAGTNNFDGPVIIDQLDSYFGLGRVQPYGAESTGPRLYARNFDPSVTGLESPIGSLCVRYDNGQVWGKDGVADTDWYLIGGGGAATAYQYCFVWRPGLAVDVENVFGAWNDLYAAADAIQGRKLIVLDPSEGDPFVMDGLLDDMQQFEFVTWGSTSVSIEVTGTWITLPARIVGPSAWQATDNKPIMNITTEFTTPYQMVLTDNVTWTGSTGDYTFIVNGTGGFPNAGPVFEIITDRSCSLIGYVGDDPAPIISMVGSSTVRITNGETCSSRGVVESDSDADGVYRETWRADAQEEGSEISPLTGTETQIYVPKRTMTVSYILDLDQTIVDTDLLYDMFQITATSGDVNVTLPDANSNFYNVRLTFRLAADDGAASKGILNAANINGATTYELLLHDSVTIMLDPTAGGWVVLSSFVA